MILAKLLAELFCIHSSIFGEVSLFELSERCKIMSVKEIIRLRQRVKKVVSKQSVTV